MNLSTRTKRTERANSHKMLKARNTRTSGNWLSLFRKVASPARRMDDWEINQSTLQNYKGLGNWLHIVVLDMKVRLKTSGSWKSSWKITEEVVRSSDRFLSLILNETRVYSLGITKSRASGLGVVRNILWKHKHAESKVYPLLASESWQPSWRVEDPSLGNLHIPRGRSHKDSDSSGSLRKTQPAHPLVRTIGSKSHPAGLLSNPLLRFQLISPFKHKPTTQDHWIY